MSDLMDDHAESEKHPIFIGTSPFCTVHTYNYEVDTLENMNAPHTLMIPPISHLKLKSHKCRTQISKAHLHPPQLTTLTLAPILAPPQFSGNIHAKFWLSIIIVAMVCILLFFTFDLI